MANIEIKSTKDIKIDSVKCVVFGSPGSGKTRLCATGPNPLIISAESGLLSLVDQNIPYIEVSTLKEFDDVYKFVSSSSEANQYDMIGLDSLSEICEVFINKILPDYKDPRQAYNALAQSIMPMLRKFRDIKGKHTLFTAKMITVKDEETGRVTDELMMPGKVLSTQIPYMVDELFYLGVNKKKEDVIHTKPSRRTFCKDRSGALSAEEEPDLTKIIEKIMAKQGKAN